MIQGNYEAALQYMELADRPMFVNFMKGIVSHVSNNYSAAINYFKNVEEMINSTGEMRDYLPYVYAITGQSYLMLDGRDNTNQALFYFRKAAEGGYSSIGYTIYMFTVISVQVYPDDEEHSDDSLYYLPELVGNDVFKWLRWSAERGFSPAYYDLGFYELNNKKNPNEASYWFHQSADAGNPLGMACYGKTLIEQGNVKEGREWLRKSLSGNAFDLYLDHRKNGIGLLWPKSRSDVQSLLDSSQLSIGETSSNANHQSSASSSSSTSQITISNQSSGSSSISSSSNSHYSPSSTSTTYNSTRTKSHRPFNQKKDEFIGGFSMGYIQKQWAFEEDGEKYKAGAFAVDDYMQGIQVGFRIDPQFGAGFGMNSGLFYEYCWDKSEEEYDEYGSYHMTYEEHGVYAPLHLKFTMNFSEWFQLSFYGGAGFNYVFSGKAYVRDDGETYGKINVFDDEDEWKHFNMMYEYGASLRIGGIQFDFSISKGITNWSEDDAYKETQGRPFTASMTFCF